MENIWKHIETYGKKWGQAWEKQVEFKPLRRILLLILLVTDVTAGGSAKCLRGRQRIFLHKAQHRPEPHRGHKTAMKPGWESRFAMVCNPEWVQNQIPANCRGFHPCISLLYMALDSAPRKIAMRFHPDALRFILLHRHTWQKKKRQTTLHQFSFPPIPDKLANTKNK